MKGRRNLCPFEDLHRREYIHETACSNIFAICNKAGLPNIFLTMTCNPNRKEITEEFLPGQKATDRPELYGKVFPLNLDDLSHMVHDTDLFRNTVTMVKVIEVRKNGLPHGYNIIFDDRQSSQLLTTSPNMTGIIQTELPRYDDRQL